MSNAQNKDYDDVKNQLDSFRKLHSSFQKIINIQSQNQRDQLICDLFKTLLNAKHTSLFALNLKNSRYQFKVASNKGGSDYSGGYLEIDEGFETVEFLPVRAEDGQNLFVQTEKGAIELKEKFVYLAPIEVSNELLGILLCEYDQPFEVADEQTIELMQVHLNFLSTFVESFVKHQSLEEKAHSLKLLYTISNKLSSVRDEEKLLENILNLIEKYIQVDRCSLMIMDADQKHLRIKKAIGMDDVDIKNIKITVGEGIAGFVAAGKRPLLIKDISQETHLISQTTKKKQFRTNSLLSVPLVAQQDVIGVINVNNRKDGLPFSESDKDLLSAIGSEIAIILQRSYIKLQMKKSKDLDRDINRLMV